MHHSLCVDDSWRIPWSLNARTPQVTSRDFATSSIASKEHTLRKAGKTLSRLLTASRFSLTPSRIAFAVSNPY